MVQVQSDSFEVRELRDRVSEGVRKVQELKNRLMNLTKHNHNFLLEVEDVTDSTAAVSSRNELR